MRGIKVELEHTDDVFTALEIAMDHLTEDPKYYEKLKTIESEGVAGSVCKNVDDSEDVELATSIKLYKKYDKNKLYNKIDPNDEGYIIARKHK